MCIGSGDNHNLDSLSQYETLMASASHGLTTSGDIALSVSDYVQKTIADFFDMLGNGQARELKGHH